MKCRLQAGSSCGKNEGEERERRAYSHRLFTVPYFSMGLWMLIMWFDGLPSWSLDASGTGESTKCPWVKAVGNSIPQAFLLASVLLASGDQDGGPSNSTTSIYDLMENRGL